MYTLWNWGDIDLSPASREITQPNKPPKHYTKTGGHNISSSLKKKRKHTLWVSATIRVQVYQETPDLARPEGKGGKTRRRMASERQINSLPGLLMSKLSDSRSALLTDSCTHQSTTNGLSMTNSSRTPQTSEWIILKIRLL